MNKFFNIIFLSAILIGGFVYRERIQNIWMQSFAYYFPCKTTITYSLGSFDTKFGVSKADFLDALKTAEKIWESPINKDLFKYEEGGRLKVNLVYDERQETTQQLKKMGVVVDNNKASYDSLKVQYDSIQSDYKKEKANFEAKVSSFESRKRAYESEVAQVNSRGGANKATLARLNTERDSLNQELISIQQIQNNLNNKIDSINALAKALNDLAKTLNMTVDKFNTIGGSLGSEFEEGTFVTDSSGQEINIYQFDNKTKLIRVLAHEMGHALGLEHNEDPKAIMYRLNNGINEKLTQTDFSELKTICGIN